jgi:3-hydroxyisobutyrate dehydrogenase-like beta-hydroxyacid dehydrogenase
LGRAIAGRLLAAGADVAVWNRSPQPVEDLVSQGAIGTADLQEAFQSDVVFSVLSNDSAVSSTLLDPQLLQLVPSSTVHVNLSTVSPELSRKATKMHAEAGIGYLAAPVFGRVPAAEAGLLNIMVAGDRSLISAVQPFFDVVGQRTWIMGTEPHHANIVKIIGNYLIACSIQSLSEAVTLAESAAVDTSELIS